MRYRNLVLAAALAASGLAGAATIAIDNGIAVKESDVATPTRGMTMTQVTAKFGAPVTKVPAVGKPPISRWEYPGFVVYFEADHVIHSVVPSAAAPGGEAPANAAPAAEAPASEAPSSAAPGSEPSSAAPSAPPGSAAPSEEPSSAPASGTAPSG